MNDLPLTSRWRKKTFWSLRLQNRTSEALGWCNGGYVRLSYNLCLEHLSVRTATFHFVSYIYCCYPCVLDCLTFPYVSVVHVDYPSFSSCFILKVRASRGFLYFYFFLCLFYFGVFCFPILSSPVSYYPSFTAVYLFIMFPLSLYQVVVSTNPDSLLLHFCCFISFTVLTTACLIMQGVSE